jgi:acyl-CoA synthetase (AMP-forming)/AMP-acid ligase II
MEGWPHCQYYNLYGPTETNVCTYYHVKTPPAGSEPIPIGRACENTDVFAVTDSFEPAKPGEVGELVVRGSSVMKGYWGLPEKTAQMVVGWTDVSGHADRLYRTGDLVALQGEDYHFFGRRDHQIKSRGYRIELGEIESALYSHASVLDAVALAIPDAEIGHRLHALVVAAGGATVNAAELSRHCGEHIPRYMVPGTIEFRDSLPKTSTGKIDRQRLLDEVTARPST